MLQELFRQRRNVSMKNTLLFVLIFITQFAFASSKKSVTLSVMTYNLENLFDTEHDLGKNDWTYLPLDFKNSSKEVQAYCSNVSNRYYQRNCFQLDWSEVVLEQKIQNLAKVITNVPGGRGADVIVFEEVENIHALRYLVKNGLKGLGYKYISLIEGPDSRGIDIGVIAKYPILSSKYHEINLRPYSTRTTRGILEVNIKVGKYKVAVFGNHWPSQANPDETRIIVAKTLKNAAKRSRADLVLAMGDFNTSDDDELNGIKKHILPYFYDVESLARRQYKVSAKGTHCFRGNWESLDKIFILKNSLRAKRISIDLATFEIIKRDFMLRDSTWVDRETGDVTTYKNIPYRFNPETGQGYSDHLPVYVELRLR